MRISPLLQPVSCEPHYSTLKRAQGSPRRLDGFRLA
jgi:hypothetical protein